MISERVYRALLVAYPSEFRGEYGELMVQFFRDRMRCDGKGARGLIVWMQLISDLAVSAFNEHAGGYGMGNGKPVIETDALSKIYGSIVAVDDLSMSVPRGHAVRSARTERLRQNYHDGNVARTRPADFRQLQPIRIYRRSGRVPAPCGSDR